MKDISIYAPNSDAASEKKEVIANIMKLTMSESIHHLLIVTRTLLRIEKEQHGE